ncbi:MULTISPECIES: M23 family metallopeptidase [unclassified Paenibacillus]|uniref:M23 family metallopeptidase n=1 Tax=unclassified Paenibacillus TaxID=185978 RepID=UPI001AE1FA4C|nr:MULTISPECIES: M23 family metallopeptidase [unclassified Paenibacillus]MBP1156583.1 stage IV sporulation protein FA [Paenibacillus sp. PvP091]MBP1172679.1 stage IV sporulation protein FA [Paenibacillus sp. PvR098]MBP2439059.1 stage IV sporulation protein FA [Paenibacillus sp. PvP052]
METRKNVRERRMEKIRKLQEGVPRRKHWEPDVSHMEFPAGRGYYETEWDRGRAERLEPDLRQDPEVEWNRKLQRDWSRHERSDYNDNGGFSSDPRTSRLAAKIMISGVLFALVWGMFQMEHPLANKGKQVVSGVLTESFDIALLSAWYENTFEGVPSFLPALGSSKHQDAEKVAAVSKHYFPPVQGKMIAAFTPIQGGVLVEVPPGAPVSALDTGLVAFAGTKEDTGFTVVIRHSAGLESIYGQLEQGSVRVGDWIKGGETLGTVAQPPQGHVTGTFYFAVSKNGKPVDPTDVVPFD